MDSIENKILLAAGHIDPDADQQAQLRELLAGDYDQDHLIRLARNEGMSGLLYKSLKKAGILGYLGHRQMQHLQSFYYRSVQQNLNTIHELKEILRRSNISGIQVVLLQGIALFEKVYKDIGLRPLTDIDLWVLPDRREAFDTLITNLGYQPDPLYPGTFKKDQTIVDINSHILWAERIKSRQGLLAKSQHAIHDDIDILRFEGQPAGCLNAVDQVLYLSLHAFKHCASRLIWLVDIKELIADWQCADWKALFDRAAELGQTHIVYDMIYLIKHLFQLKLPEEIEQMFAEQGFTWLERSILARRLNGNHLPDWAPLLLFTSGKDLKTRVCFVFETLFPRPEILRQVFANSAKSNVWHLYLKRFLQLLSHAKL